MLTGGKNPPLLFFILGIVCVGIGLIIKFFGYPSETTARGIPIPIFVPLTITIGIACFGYGLYCLYKRRSS